jgi:hypothetical protein
MNEFNAVSAEELTQVDGGWPSLGDVVGAVAAVAAFPALVGTVAVATVIVATERPAY